MSNKGYEICMNIDKSYFKKFTKALYCSSIVDEDSDCVTWMTTHTYLLYYIPVATLLASDVVLYSRFLSSETNICVPTDVITRQLLFSRCSEYRNAWHVVPSAQLKKLQTRELNADLNFGMNVSQNSVTS